MTLDRLNEVLTDHERTDLEQWIAASAKHTPFKRSIELYSYITWLAREAVLSDDPEQQRLANLWSVGCALCPSEVEYLCAVEMWDGQFEQGSTPWRFRSYMGVLRYEDQRRRQVADQEREARRRRERMQRIEVPPSQLENHLARRLKRDYDARLSLAQSLGATIRGNPQRADDITCPSCGRKTVYYYIEPGARSVATCKHENSCGWFGQLLTLARD